MERWMDGLVDGWVDISNKQSDTDYLRVLGPVSQFFLTASLWLSFQHLCSLYHLHLARSI